MENEITSIKNKEIEINKQIMNDVYYYYTNYFLTTSISKELHLTEDFFKSTQEHFYKNVYISTILNILDKFLLIKNNNYKIDDLKFNEILNNYDKYFKLKNELINLEFERLDKEFSNIKNLNDNNIKFIQPLKVQLILDFMNYFDLLNYLYNKKLIDENKLKEIFDKWYLIFTKSQISIMFSTFIIRKNNFSDIFKDFLINNYFQNQAIKKLLE